MVEHQFKRGIVRPLARSRTLSRVGLLAIMAAAYAVLPVVWKEHSEFKSLADTPAEIHAALTLVLGWLLVFRTNTAYSRWWEARTVWGEIVSVTRTLAAKFAFMVKVPRNELESAGRDLVGFSWGLRDHLREQAELAELPGFEECQDSTCHIPVYLIDRMYGLLRRWKEMNWIDGADQRVIDADLRRLHELAGRCESIRLTRLASSYRVFVRQCIVVFLLTFPWGMSGEFGWWTVPLTAVTAYFMLGLEIVAEHVEEPFGHDEDDLDLDRLCESVSVTVNETLLRERVD